MIRKKNIFIVCLILVILGGIAFFLYSKFKPTKKETFPLSENTQNIQTNVPTENSAKSDTISSAENQETSESSDTFNTKETEKAGSLSIETNKRNSNSKVFASITNEHCNTDCEAFGNNFEYLEYCQQVCGILPIKDVSDCNNKKDLEKDYCYKDMAINKKNASLCEKVDDANIRQTCKNRILQDIIEGK